MYIVDMGAAIQGQQCLSPIGVQGKMQRDGKLFFRDSIAKKKKMAIVYKN